MEHEIWKDISGYEGDYQVSNLANIRSLRYANNGSCRKGSGIKNLKLIKHNNGYLVVNLYKNGRMKQFSVHRLVAEAFIPNPSNLPEIDHINTITTDNNITNLRWCTHKENINNPISSKRRLGKCIAILKSMIGAKHHSSRSVAQYTKNGTFIKIWGSMSDVSRELGIDSGCLTRACQGIQKTAGGFVWKYCERQIEKTAVYGT